MSTEAPDAEAKRALVVERLKQAALSHESAPLSFAQQRLWFLDQLEPDSPLYNIGVIARFAGPLDVEALGRALNSILARHEALRTRFICPKESPEQLVDPQVNLVLDLVDLTHCPDSEREEESRRLIRLEVNRPFNLSADRLIRARLHCLSPTEHQFILILHHIVADEWSLRILFRELDTFYQAELTGQPPQLPELPIQYSDFAIWQRDSLKGDTLERLLSYWRKQLGGKPPMTQLPTDRPRRLSPTFRGGHVARSLDLTLAQQIRELASDQETTLFMVLLAAFKVLVHRYTQQQDLIVGSPIAGRTRIETEPLIGFFVNTLPLRTNLADDPTFAELLRRVRETTLGAYAHQDLPFERMVEELQPERSLNHMPFTKVMFVLQNSCLEEFSMADLRVELEQVTSDLAKFELTLVIKETTHGLLAHVEYNSDLFDAGTVERLLGHYETLLRAVASEPQQAISRLPMLTGQEESQLLIEWNDTRTAYPSDASVHELFEGQAVLRPGAIAVIIDGKKITYGDLNQRANQLARHLARLNIGPETLVTVCLDHSIEVVVAFLAVLKTGAAYIPLDPEYPKERLAFMLSDSGTPLLLTQASIAQKLPPVAARVICLDRDWEPIASESSENLTLLGNPDALAYVMYTSGSTGRPKGVAVPHRGVVRLVRHTNYVSLNQSDRIAQVSNISFDAATFEIWGALLNGGQLIGFSREELLSPELFAHNLRRHGITAMFLTSALFNQLAAQVPGAFEPLRTLIVGGEALDPKWIRAVLHDRPPQRLLNGYGPTENTTFTCCYHIRGLPESAANVPIGKPIANTEVYILDPTGNPVPIGVPGELYAGGDGLAKGYFRQPSLTAERFIRHSFQQPAGSKHLYRTGDLARYLPDGNIEFLGRVDEQVKLRGFRIELGEIESVLTQHAGVKECVVVVHRQPSGEKQLVAYFTPKQPAPNASQLKEFLAEQLPTYMIPSSFVEISALPLTANGKVDRQVLAGLVVERPRLAPEYATARDPVEIQLTAIWEKVLAVRPIGVRDRFFDLGGHSLLAVRVIGEIEKAFGKKLRLATIFHAPTIHQLAAILRDEIKETCATTDSSLVEIQGEGTRPPLFLVHGAGGGMFWGYVNLSRYLGSDQPVYAFKSKGLDGGCETEQIEEMARQYLNDLRRLQPHGPYYLGGYCFGGNVAYEMARQLVAQNESVALLALFNCAAPNSGYTRIEYTPRWLLRFVRNLVYLGSYFFEWNARQRRQFFRWKWSLLKKHLAARGGGSPGELSQVEAGDLVDLSSFSGDQRRTWEAHIRALVAFHPKPFDGQVHLFRSPGHPLLCSFDPGYGWAEFAKRGVKVTVLPGAHEKILEEPCVQVLGREMARSLEMAQRGASDSTTPIKDEEQCLAYWKKQLANSPGLLDLPGDHPRPAQHAARLEPLPMKLGEPLVEAVEVLSRSEGDALLPFLMAALAALLHRYSGSEDIVIGTRVRRSNGQSTVVPLRCTLTGDVAFLDLARRVRTILDEAKAHSALPFERMVELVCGDQHNPSYAPVFQVMLTIDESAQAISAEIPLAAAIGEDPERLDLVLHLQRSAEGLTGSCHYSPCLFHPSRIERLIEHYRTLLTAAVADPRGCIAKLPLMAPAERDQVLLQWNRTETADPIERTLIELFDEQVAQTPDAVAVVGGTTRLTYRQLQARANFVARQLSRQGVTRETLVGVFHERTAEMISAMLGILKAGGAYVPLDPAYPKQRLQAILEDANARVVLTQQKLLDVLPTTRAKVVCLDAIEWGGDGAAEPTPNELGTSRNTSPGDLAYVIYTSGSTGKPKGVALEHRGAVALIYWAKGLFGSKELSGVLASTSICFDLSVFEIFVPLCAGGKVILAENALALPNLPAAQDVSLINTVPSAMKELLRARAVPKSVVVVNLAGEPLTTELVDQIYGQTNVKKVYDLYGPTETTTYSTGSLRVAGAAATIGRPLSNEKVYLLDRYLQPVPIGVPGELCIGGVGIARGYLNQPELTQQKFISDPFNRGGRLYRTGDLARWRNDGCLEYLGRIDHQVKIRGFRIELGEIEALLRSHPGVREAVVLAREDNPGDKRLVAYVVAQTEGTLSSGELQASLQAQLPHYMVPSSYLFLTELPLTPNGKVDRKALPAPKPDSGKPVDSIIPPRNGTEKQLCDIWKEVLRQDQIGVADNFFDLGGHSLLAAQVVVRIRDTFGVDLPLAALFDVPTIEALAQGIASGRWASKIAPIAPMRWISRDGPSPVSFVQERLWFLDQLQPDRDAYNVPAALRLKGKLNLAAFRQALNSVVNRHEVLRTTFLYSDQVLTQVVATHLDLKCLIEDFSHTADPEAEALSWISRQAQRPFELGRGPLIRTALARLSGTDHVFLIVMHHTICDGWSLALFFEELSTQYAAAASGHVLPSLPQDRLQYIDFAHWQRQNLQGETLDRCLEFWKQALTGAPNNIELPADFDAPKDSEAKAARVETVLPPAVVAQMNNLAQTESVTVFMQLITALAVTLQQWTNQNDLVIGTVVAGRTLRDMESMLGCFMNFLPIRAKVSPGQTAREILAAIRANVLEAHSHQDCPFERIVEAVNPERKSNRNPLYNVALLFQNFPAELFRGDSLEVSRVPVALDAALLDLRFEAEQTAHGFSLMCEYRKDLFESTTVQELLRSFVQVLETMVRSPQARSEDLKITEPLQSHGLKHRRRHDRQTIAIAATFTAEPIADPLRYWLRQFQFDDEIEFAPYNQVFQQLLDPRSLLANNERGVNIVLLRLTDWHRLNETGPVDLHNDEDCLERNANEFISGLKSAALRTSTPWLVCFCPPPRTVLAEPGRAQALNRIEQFMIAELDKLGGVYQLGSAEFARWYPVTDYDDPSAEELGNVPYTPLLFSCLATALARKLHALTRSPYKVIVLDCDQTLWCGVCGEDGPKGVVLDPGREKLQQFMRAQHSAGMLLCLCSKNNESDALEVFGQRLDFPLRLEHFAAWRLNWELKSKNLKSLAQQLKLGLDSFIFIDDNPLECAEMEANCPEVLVLQLPESPGLIPSFLDHCWAFDQLKITEEDRRRGELYRQNQRREQLLAESPSLAEFVDGLQLQVEFTAMTDSQLTRVAQLMQRTNQFNCTAQRLTEADLQTRLADSQVVAVQVRDRFGDYGLVGVMIYRSEPGTLVVDSFLLSCRALGRGVEHRMLAYLGEIAREHRAEGLDLHFVRSGKNQPALEFFESVGSAFKQALNGGYVFRFPAGFAAEVAFNPPSHKSQSVCKQGSPPPISTPSLSRRFTRYREIALQANDPHSLHHQIEAAVQVRARQQGEYLAPRTDLEGRLCELWQKLLRMDRVGVRDDFFELGGHSLLAVRLFAEIERSIGKKLPLVSLFHAPTVEQLAALVKKQASPNATSLLVPIQPEGTKAPLFLIHGAGGDVLWGYANLAAHLPQDQPIYGIKSCGQAGLEEFRSLREMASYYLQVIREFQPEGPYHLGGYCFGGNVAYEIARQLQEQGQRVGLVALIDSAPSNAGYENVNWWRVDFSKRFVRNLSHWLKDFAALKYSEQRNFIARKFRSCARQLKRRFFPGTAAPNVDLEAIIDPRHFPEHELRLWQIHLQALIEHVEGTYPGQVMLLRTRGQPLLCSLEEDFCWSKLAQGGVVVKLVPGSHENIFQEPNVQHLAKQLAESLAAAQNQALQLRRRGQLVHEVRV